MTKYIHNQICIKAHMIEVGKQYQYKEDSLIANVTVLEDNTDSEGLKFKLRIDKTLSHHELTDYIFDVFAAHGMYAYGGMWRLYDLGEYVRFQPGLE